MSISNIGKRVFIAEGLPATNDAAGFEALTWVEIADPQVIGALGVSNANVDVPNLSTGFTSGVKGAGTGNEVAMTFAMKAGDAGQALSRTLANTPGDGADCSLKIIKPSGARGVDGKLAIVVGDPVQYAHGYFGGYAENQADTTTHEGFTGTFKQNDYTVDAVEPA